VLELPLPEPFGRTSCIEVGEGEDQGFAVVAGGRSVERYLCFADPPLRLALHAINALRLTTLLPRAAFVLGARRNRGTASREPTVIWVGACHRKRRLGVRILECEGDYRTTATLARLFAIELLHHPSQPGCFNPEDVLTLEQLAPSLDGIGLRVTTTQVG
jgi:hypothetical protein